MGRGLWGILLAGLASCVLVVSPDEYGQRCRFKGEASRCGSCLTARCQPFIDECCRDAACAGTLEHLERCAQGEVARCTSLGGDSDAAESSRSNLGRCAETQCRAECASGLTKSITQCTVPAFGQGRTCTCAVNDTPNDTLCSEATFPATVCCAPEGWPSPGLRCSCRVLSCSSTGDGCSCMLSDGAPDAPTCTSKTCCLLGDTCACSAKDCLSDEKKVASCSLANIECAVGQKRVTSCSAGN